MTAATYASLKTRVLQNLNDALAVRYPDLAIQEAMRLALSAYNSALPQIKSSVITVSTAGVTQSLSTLTTLTKVIALIYPYIAGMDEKPTQNIAYFVYFDAGVPMLYMPSVSPAVDEKIKLVYYATHLISGLDAGESTTLPPHHETQFCEGVCSFACKTRAHALLEAFGDRSADYTRLMEQGQEWEDKFNTFLAQNSPAQQFAFPAGFKLDQWDK
jgi:hypothetical protein